MLRPTPYARNIIGYQSGLAGDPRPGEDPVFHAVKKAWGDPGTDNYFAIKAHYVLQNMVRSMFPILARALDRACYGEYFLDALEYRNARAEQRARDRIRASYRPRVSGEQGSRPDRRTAHVVDPVGTRAHR